MRVAVKRSSLRKTSTSSPVRVRVSVRWLMRVAVKRSSLRKTSTNSPGAATAQRGEREGEGEGGRSV